MKEEIQKKLLEAEAEAKALNIQVKKMEKEKSEILIKLLKLDGEVGAYKKLLELDI